MAFTKEELEEMARADAEIEAEFEELSWQEFTQSEELERAAEIDALAPEKRLKKEQHKEWYQKNKGRLHKKAKEYRDGKRDELNAYFREYYGSHKESEAARKHAWYERNKQKVLNHQREYRSNNPEKRRNYYLENRERILKYQKEYRERKKGNG